MKLIIRLIVFIFLINDIYSLIPLTFKKAKYTSYSTIKENISSYIKYIDRNELIVPIEIGTPNQSLLFSISTTNPYFYIFGESTTFFNNSIPEHLKRYKSNESISFKKIDTIRCISYIYDSGDSITDNIKINNNNYKDLGIVLVNNFKLNQIGSSYSGVIGLGIPRIKCNDHSIYFLDNLNNRNIINSYNYFIDYKRNIILLGGTPNEYNKTIYKHNNFKYFRSSIYWNFYIDDLMYNKIRVNISKIYKDNQMIHFEYGYIVTDLELKNLLDKNYFNEMISLNICYTINIRDPYYDDIFTYYYCNNSNPIFNETKHKLGILTINNNEINEQFELNLSTLFKEDNNENISFFLIKFCNYGHLFILGAPFFEKYNIMLDLRLKRIGFYIDNNLDNKSIPLKYILIIAVIIFLFILIILILWFFDYKIIMKLYKKKKGIELLNEDYIG